MCLWYANRLNFIVIARALQKSEAIHESSANLHSVIARRVSEANATKQSISANLESKANRLLYANLWLDSSIRSWVIDSLGFSKSRDLDCHENATHFLAMTTHFTYLTLPTKEPK